MKGRFNLFQAAMLRWRTLHPYNAVHVAAVCQPFDPAKLETAIAGQLCADGLTGLELDPQRRRYEYRGGPAVVPFEVLAGGGAPGETLRAEIERQLNQPFPATGAIVPFRFFALADGDVFHVGLAYDHFVAGGDSIVALLNDIVARYGGAPRDTPPPDLYPPTFARLFARNAGKLVGGLPWLRRTVASCRRGVRPRYDDEADGRNVVVFVRLDGAEVAALLARAKAWDVTFNDLLLAALLKVLAAHVPPRAAAARRSDIAVASIVNLRAACGLGLRDAFGQFLSSLRLSHRVPPGTSLETLARDVKQETARIKADRLYLQTLVAMRFNALVWTFLNDHRRQRLYSKTFPVWAGLTTLNVNALWTARPGVEMPAGYRRAVPTGPVAPMVVAATTCGTTLELGISYRASALVAPRIARIASDLQQTLVALQ